MTLVIPEGILRRRGDSGTLSPMKHSPPDGSGFF